NPDACSDRPCCVTCFDDLAANWSNSWRRPHKQQSYFKLPDSKSTAL
ncbi:hypothetical protein MTO96_034341, partial [Rhipicephalus appendiculatus]